MALLLHQVLTEQSRCRQLARENQALGSAGAFGLALLQTALERSDFALASGDERAMQRCLADLHAFLEPKRQPLPLKPPPQRRGLGAPSVRRQAMAMA